MINDRQIGESAGDAALFADLMGDAQGLFIKFPGLCKFALLVEHDGNIIQTYRFTDSIASFPAYGDGLFVGLPCACEIHLILEGDADAIERVADATLIADLAADFEGFIL